MADQYVFRVRFDFQGNAGAGIAEVQKVVNTLSKLDQKMAETSQSVRVFDTSGRRITNPTPAVQKATAAHTDAGLGGSVGAGAEAAQNALSLVKNVDTAIFQIGQKIRQMLPQAQQDALDQMAQREQAAMQASLQRAVEDAAQKKQIYEQLLQQETDARARFEAAYANAQAHPRSNKAADTATDAKAELEAVSKARQQAQAEMVAADTRAAQVAEESVNRVKTLTVAAAKEKASAEKEAQQEIEAENRKWAAEAKQQAKELADAEKRAAREAEAEQKRQLRETAAEERKWAKEAAQQARELAEAEKKAAKDKAAAEKQAANEAKKAAADEKKAQKEAADAVAQNVASIKSKIAGIGQVFNGFTQGFNRFANGFRLIAQGLQEVGQTVAIYVAAPLGLALKEGIGLAITWEQQWAKVKKALEMPTEKVDYGWLKMSKEDMDALSLKDLQTQAIDTLEQRLRNLAKITPTTIEQLGQIAEAAAQVGVKGGPGLYRFTNLINKMVIGTDVDANTITEDMARIAGAFGQDLNTEEGMRWAEGIASVMDLVAKKTSTNVQGIMTAMKDAATVGPMLKINADQVAAALGVLISSGVDPSAAGTVLTRFYRQVLGSTENFAKAMAGYKRQLADGSWIEPYKNANDVLKAINDEPIAVLTDTIKALNEATDESRAQELKNFYDAAGQVGGRIGAMAGNYSSLKEMLNAAAKEMSNPTELLKDYEAMLQTSSAQMEIFKNNVRDLGMSLGQALLPTLNQIVGYAVPAVQALGAAFNGLDNQTKLLVVGIPLLVVALTPVLLLLGSLIHVVTLVAMSLGAFAMGFGNIIGDVFGAASKLGLLTKLFGGVASGAVAAGEGVTAAGEAAAGAAGGFGTLLSSIITLVASNPLVSFAIATIAVFKILSTFGLDVAKYFLELAENAKAWGENMMLTYGEGLLGGAARVISEVVSTIAQWIANFFEAHSPPKVGPLSTIDQWGKGLMNTYLKGFLLADFSILSDVGSLIKQALTDVAELGGGSFADFGDIFMQWRGDLAQIIEVFNQTGKIAEDVLSRIGSNLGSLGKDIQELVRDWLEYNKLQKELKDLENQRKQVESQYDDQVDAIAKRTDISAEEKAELIRQATMKRNEELDKIDEEKKKTEEAADAAKDKLDWQKEYVKAQLEELDLLREMKKEREKKDAGGGGSLGNVKFDPSKGLGGLGSSVKDLGEEFNSVSKKIEAARVKVNEFFNALQGKKFGDGLSPEALRLWQKEDPQGFKEAKDLYDMGAKAHEVWTNLQGPLTKVGQLLGIVKKETQGPKQVPPFIQELQRVLDIAASNGNVFAPLTEAFKEIQMAGRPLKDTFNRIGETLDVMGIKLPPVKDSWQLLGGILSFVFGLVVTVVVGAINIISTAIAWILRIGTTLIVAISGMFTGLVQIVEGLTQIIFGIFNGDMQQVVTGVAALFAGAWNLLYNFFFGIYMVALEILMGIVDIVWGAIRDIAAYIAGFFGGPQAAEQVRSWFNNIRQMVMDQWQEIENRFNTATENITKFFSNLRDNFPSIVKGLGQAIQDALKGQFDGVLKFIQKFIDDALGLLGKLTGITITTSSSTSSTTSTSTNTKTPGRALGGVAMGPTRALIAEAGMPEAIIPLNRLPSLMHQMYGGALVGSFSDGSGVTVNINHPVVREEQDIKKIVKEVRREMELAIENKRRMRGG